MYLKNQLKYYIMRRVVLLLSRDILNGYNSRKFWVFLVFCKIIFNTLYGLLSIAAIKNIVKTLHIKQINFYRRFAE